MAGRGWRRAGDAGGAGAQVLFLAAMAGNEDMVEALVSLKANLEAADKIKFTPLMAAAASGLCPTRPAPPRMAER